jgi:hypothetical protein
MHARRYRHRFPWYDSIWLRKYVKAKEYIAQHVPTRLVEFVAAFDPLRTRADFEVAHLKNVIAPETMMRIREAIAALDPASFMAAELHEIRDFGRWVVHDDPILSELQASMTALVTNAVGEAVEPSYNFLSLYSRLGRCAVHMDSPQAKWTLDVCIDQSEPWPIHFSRIVDWPEDYRDDADPDWDRSIRENPQNAFTSYTLQPGEALVFSGSSQWHYRDPLPSGNDGYCHLLFFHFVPAGMLEIAQPRNWETRFDIPGLAGAID